jgi:SOS response regulatory protein OraA/RecX
MWNKPSKTKEPNNEAKAYEYAVFLLSLQLRTVGEVREKMIGRGYTSAIIEKVLKQLISQKYLDDERYAQVFLENLKTYKNLGYYGIKKKFKLKKLPTELVSKVLDEGLSLEDELKIARRFLSHHSPGVILRPSASEAEESFNADDGENSYNTFDEQKSKQKQKLSAKLKSRGFRGEVIAKLLY